MEHRENVSSEWLHRLERTFTDQQTSFQQTRDEVNSLKTGYNIIQRDIVALGSNVERLVSRFEESSKTNWPLLALAAGLIPLLVGGMGYLMTSFTANAISPVHTEIVQVETALKSTIEQIKEVATIQTGRGKDLGLMSQTVVTNSNVLSRMSQTLRSVEEKTAESAAADANSKADRDQLNQRVAKLESILANEITDRRATSAETRIQLAEVEQQFHSVSNLENLRAAQQERLNAMLWEKSHPGERYPNGTFFPTSIFQGAGGAPPMQISAPPQ